MSKGALDELSRVRADMGREARARELSRPAGNDTLQAPRVSRRASLLSPVKLGMDEPRRSRESPLKASLASPLRLAMDGQRATPLKAPGVEYEPVVPFSPNGK